MVVDHPVEECALEPVKSCHQVTGRSPHHPHNTSTRFVSLQVSKLVPKLVPVEECVDVPHVYELKHVLYYVLDQESKEAV